MTHERCSELLAGYVRSELAHDVADEVRAHLAECADCRSEERAVVAMAAGPAGEPMDDLERARLHRGLAQELFAERANADVAGVAAGPPRWARWLVPAAAAAVVAAGVFVVTRGGTDDAVESFSARQGADTDAGEVAEQGVQDAAPEAAGGGGGAGKDTNRSRALGATAEQGSSFDMASAAPVPEFDRDLGPTSTDDLEDLGRSGGLFRTIAESYLPSDGPGLYDRFLETLVDGAADAGEEVRDCAATLPEDGSLIPAYGSLAEYEEGDVLVLGFVTNDPDSKTLDRYLIWVWERGSCAQPIDTLFGEIDFG